LNPASRLIAIVAVCQSRIFNLQTESANGDFVNGLIKQPQPPQALP